MAEHAATAAATSPAAAQAFPAAGEIRVVASAEAATARMPFVRMFPVCDPAWIEMMMVVMTLPQGVQQSMMQAHGQIPICRKSVVRYIFRYI
jgi:hypothetical protein